MFRRILVTLDGSDFAEAALPAAAGIARMCAAKLRLLTVHDAAWAMFRGDERDAGRGRAERYLKEVKERLQSIAPEISAEVREGYVIDEVLLGADDYGADLIVMATHGRGPVSGFWLGSVAHQIVRRAGRPLLLVRPLRPGAEPPSVPLAIGKIVVPLDGSALAETAIPSALEIAGLFGSTLTLLRVVPAHVAPVSDLIPQTLELNAKMVWENRSDAAAYLGRVGDKLGQKGIRVALETLVHGEVAAAILETAGEDLIVMATHARRGLNRAVLGSVADSVVRSAIGPVLVVPPHETAGPYRAAAETLESNGRT